LAKFDIYLNYDLKIIPVECGFSWAGFYFGFVWMFTKALWFRAAITLVVIIFVVVAGIWLLSSFGEDDYFLNFLALIWLLVGFYVGSGAYDWRVNQLQNQGFCKVGVIDAISKWQAQEKFYKNIPVDRDILKAFNLIWNTARKVPFSYDLTGWCALEERLNNGETDIAILNEMQRLIFDNSTDVLIVSANDEALEDAWELLRQRLV